LILDDFQENDSDEFLDEDIDDRAEDKAIENDKNVEWGRLFIYVRNCAMLCTCCLQVLIASCNKHSILLF
jgi:hypothetical protein